MDSKDVSAPAAHYYGWLDWFVNQGLMRPETADAYREQIAAGAQLDSIELDGHPQKVAEYVEDDRANRREVIYGMAQDIIRDPKHFRAGNAAMRRFVRRVRRGLQGRNGNGSRPVRKRRAVQRTHSRGPDDDSEPPPLRAASRASVISTPIEIDLLFASGPTAEAKRHAICGYCGSHTRAVYAGVVHWFYSHECHAEFLDEFLASRKRALIRHQRAAA